MDNTKRQLVVSADLAEKYGARDCPIRSALAFLAGDKWRHVVLLELAASGERQFGQLLRAVGGVRTKALTKSLRALEAANLVNREVIVGTPTRVTYRLTESAIKAVPILLQLQDWVQSVPTEPRLSQ